MRTYQPARLPDGSRNPKHRTRPTGRRGRRGRRGRSKNKFEFGQFCAWDGEGLTIGGDHKYVLLANNLGEHTWNIAGLSTLDILGTICASARAQDRRTTHVIFGGSYDVNCWLKDLSMSALKKVWSGEWVCLADYRYKIQYRTRRSFVIHELATGTRVTIWDVWGFFQGTFVGALEKYNIPVPPHLRAMKKARAKFKASQRQTIINYCLDECRLLTELMLHVKEHLTTCGLTIRRWDGAGACAAALHMREGTREHQAQAPASVRRAAQFAYAGGRIESLRYGHAPNIPLHHYDINSAYPAGLTHCPSLTEGVWEHYTGPNIPDNLGAFTLYRVRWLYSASVCRAYPFFWRAPTGNIYYPGVGEAWCWGPEYRAARHAEATNALTGRCTVLEAYTWRPASTSADTRPFAFIPTLYEQRAEWKRQKIGAEKMLKLALNSLYGKNAQHVGGDGKAPRYHQLEWAGFVTSQTRALLFRAACEAGPDAVMISTDGIFSTALIPSLNISPALGDWDYQCHVGATVVQSGVYWLDNADADGIMTTTDFSRGFDRGSLNRAAIVKCWRQKILTYDAQLTRFVTMGAIIQTLNKKGDWRQWRTAPRVLSLSPSGTKRIDRIVPERWHRRAGSHPAYGYIPTLPAIPAALFVVENKMSAAYPLPWVTDADLQLAETADILAQRIVEQELLDIDS